MAWYLRAEATNYCPSGSVPSLPHASATAVRTVGSTTSYTCASGYQSSAYPTLPSFICEPYTESTGQWTANSYSCERTHSLLFMALFFCYKWVLLYALTELHNFCDSTTAPILLNAVSQTPQADSGATTYYTCDEGYRYFWGRVGKCSVLCKWMRLKNSTVQFPHNTLTT